MHISRTLRAGLWLLAVALLVVRPAPDVVAARGSTISCWPTRSSDPRLEAVFPADQERGLSVGPAAQPEEGRPAGTQVAEPAPAPETSSSAPQARPESPVTIAVTEESPTSGEAKPTANRPSPQVYTVRRGDRLSRIAKRFHVTTRALANANGLNSRARVRPGVKLRIPESASQAREAKQDADASAGASLGYSALLYRGVPYRYAGMSSRGMDCSGLVARVLQLHGVRAPHSSRALFQLGKPVAKKGLQPDDLVFFSTRGRGISHVGIYLGDGKFIHASSGGGRVQTDSLVDGYYAKHYVGARRLG